MMKSFFFFFRKLVINTTICKHDNLFKRVQSEMSKDDSTQLCQLHSTICFKYRHRIIISCCMTLNRPNSVWNFFLIDSKLIVLQKYFGMSCILVNQKASFIKNKKKKKILYLQSNDNQRYFFSLKYFFFFFYYFICKP